MPIYNEANCSRKVKIDVRKFNAFSSGLDEDKTDLQKDCVVSSSDNIAVGEFDETTHSRDRDYPSHMVPKLITLPYELEVQNTQDGMGSKQNIMPKRKKATPRMANYHYFYELYK